MAVMALPITAQVSDSIDADSKYAIGLLKKGEIAPNFVLKTVEGTDFSLGSLKGKFVVLDFWASWCPDCRKDIPSMSRIYDKYHKYGVEFVGVSFDTSLKNWSSAIELYKIPYIQVSELKKFHDTGISKAYGISWIPSLYLISPNGEILINTVLSEKLEKKLSEMFPEAR